MFLHMVAMVLLPAHTAASDFGSSAGACLDAAQAVESYFHLKIAGGQGFDAEIESVKDCDADQRRVETDTGVCRVGRASTTGHPVPGGGLPPPLPVPAAPACRLSPTSYQIQPEVKMDEDVLTVSLRQISAAVRATKEDARFDLASVATMIHRSRNGDRVHVSIGAVPCSSRVAFEVGRIEPLEVVVSDCE